MPEPEFIDFFADNHNGITPDEIMFCRLYVDNGQIGAKAGRIAWPHLKENKDLLDLRVAETLRKSRVRQLINEKLNDRLECADLDLEWVEKRLKVFANANIQDHFNPLTGKQIPVKDLPRSVAATISELTVDQVGELRREKTKLYSAEGALKTLGTMFKPEGPIRYELTGKDGKPMQVEHSGGVLAVPVICSASTWVEDAGESQDAVMKTANEDVN